jgi:hypothetical protein
MFFVAAIFHPKRLSQPFTVKVPHFPADKINYVCGLSKQIIYLIKHHLQKLLFAPG